MLLPPSESKESGGRAGHSPGAFDHCLGEPRRQVLTALGDHLRLASVAEASRVLGVRGPLLERALDASARLAEGTAPLLPAWQRYNGVVWSHLDPGTLDETARARVLVPSALYGLNASTDLIADYRLTFKVGLAPLGGLTAFWRPALAEAFSTLGGATLVDLLPKEHAAAVPVGDSISATIVRVTFRRAKGEGVAGHDAKAVKGVLARRVLEDGPEIVPGFRWRGWRGRERAGQLEVLAPRQRVS